ncbi:MAG: high-potential iron-sulfur protein, partial [Pseudomonadales bacterium]
MPSRRNFIKASASLALIPLVSLDVRAAEKVPASDATAKALKYVQDAANASRMDKMGVAGADQYCDNCQFYTVTDDSWGGCSLFQNRLVAAKGWCMGWVPK